MDTANSGTPQGPTGMRAFLLVWFGQLISMLGSTMTWFALTFWAWQLTGEATALALVGFFSFAPSILIAPLAGALVDRLNRKLVMILSDLAAGVSTIIVLLLYATDSLQIWHLYATGAFASVFQAFQWPAYSAAISTMLPKEQYARANGMIGMAEAGANIVAPILASVLLVAIGVSGVMVIDIVTFVLAVAMVLFVHIPQPKESAAGQASKGSLWKESGFGFRYILARPSLLGLQLVFFGINFVGTFGNTVSAAMILARSGSDAAMLGLAQAAAGAGGVCGGLLLSIWGGPKRKVNGVLGGMILSSVGFIILGLGQNVIMWGLGMFIALLIMPITNGSNQAIWQAKVPPDIQGRVFSVRRMIAQITVPVAMLLAGPLADNVFEPGMRADGAMASTFGPLVGTGPGAGMALMVVISAVVGAFVGLAGYAFRAVREAESILPDHDSDGAALEAPAPAPLGELQVAEA